MDSGGASDGTDDDPRGCPSCGTRMKPVGLRSGEIVSRCPGCDQIAI